MVIRTFRLMWLSTTGEAFWGRSGLKTKPQLLVFKQSCETCLISSGLEWGQNNFISSPHFSNASSYLLERHVQAFKLTNHFWGKDETQNCSSFPELSQQAFSRRCTYWGTTSHLLQATQHWPILWQNRCDGFGTVPSHGTQGCTWCILCTCYCRMDHLKFPWMSQKDSKLVDPIQWVSHQNGS